MEFLEEQIKNFVMEHDHLKRQTLVVDSSVFFCSYAKFVSEDDADLEFTYNTVTGTTMSILKHTGKYMISVVTNGDKFAENYFYAKRIIKAKKTLKRFVNDYVIPYLYRPPNGSGFKRLQEILEKGQSCW